MHKIVFVVLALLCHVATAQNYPTRPIRFIMAYPPGGSSDVLARPIAHEMSKSLGQQMLIDYKPGGGTTIAADLVAKSPPDGYTVIMLLTAHAINATLVPKLPYDTQRDFASITLAAVQPLIVVVNAQSPIRSIQELIAAAKANPGKLNYGSAGPGNTSHLAVELFNVMVGAKISHIPYKGSGPAVTALLAREIDLMFDSLSTSAPHANGGRFRALAVTTTKRSHAVPDVPTMQEAGVAGFDVAVWYAIFARAGTPPEIVKRLNAAVSKAMQVTEAKERIESAGYTIIGSTPEELDQHVKVEIARWGKVIRDAGITAE
ncbi:MAG: tripartite tricarboxylate transporter substrate binding protein [Betaproteobacteria bacterium]|nr:tripartite tricarboxylate transporter substrate binding protein [Betaproteobacteria bacterium]